MARNQAKDEIEMSEKNRRILEEGFRIFAEQTIEKVKMTDVAEAAGVGIATLYRYYATKTALVLAISTYGWKAYTQSNYQKTVEPELRNTTAAEDYSFYLDSFLDLYRNHRNLLRFNQFFNVYIQSESISVEEINPYTEMIRTIESRFEKIWQKGKQDGTLRTDISAKKIFSQTLHLMLAAATRYAVGLVYNDGETDPEEELLLLKEMLIAHYVNSSVV